MVDFMKNQMSLYYTNRGHVCIIKWVYFLCNPHRTAVVTFIVFHKINQNWVSVQVWTKVTSLYYTNIPPISIIKWHLIFHKVHHKKVLLHIQQYQKLVYVVHGEVWHLKFPTKWTLFTIDKSPYAYFTHTTNFVLIWLW